MRLRIRPTHAVGLLAVLAIVAIGFGVVLLLTELRTRDQVHATHETESLARMLLE
jgi:hypothetical protein